MARRRGATPGAAGLSRAGAVDVLLGPNEGSLLRGLTDRGRLRVLDFANPHAPKEVAWYLPDASSDPRAKGRVQSNDVTIDSRGLIYLLDRIHGCHILERI